MGVVRSFVVFAVSLSREAVLVKELNSLEYSGCRWTFYNNNHPSVPAIDTRMSELLNVVFPFQPLRSPVDTC